MSKYCRPMGLYVTYLDCMECEDKECLQSHRKENKMIDRDYIKAENKAYDNLVEKGYTPQGVDRNLKTVCVMKFEHPEYSEHPVKRGKCEVLKFKNWQEADMSLPDRKESDKMLASIICEPNDIVYLVFCSKKHGARENIIFKARVEMVTITTEGIRYHAYCLKCVNNKKVDKELQDGKWVNHYRFGNQTINNGFKTTDLYPVFTTKEKCIEWLKA